MKNLCGEKPRTSVTSASFKHEARQTFKDAFSAPFCNDDGSSALGMSGFFVCIEVAHLSESTINNLTSYFAILQPRCVVDFSINSLTTLLLLLFLTLIFF